MSGYGDFDTDGDPRCPNCGERAISKNKCENNNELLRLENGRWKAMGEKADRGLDWRDPAEQLPEDGQRCIWITEAFDGELHAQSGAFNADTANAGDVFSADCSGVVSHDPEQVELWVPESEVIPEVLDG
ncbi:MAG: hypothetical protein ABEN55_20370 [Bradymonadaceae bacterium]